MQASMGVFELDRRPGAVDVFTWSTRKFKTVSVRFALLEELDADTAGRALVVGLLRRGTPTYPDMMRLSRRLEELFGAALGIDVVKIGERHNTVLRLEVLHDRFVDALGGGGASVLADALGLFMEVLTDPLTVGDSFPAASFEQERENLVHMIEGVLDDKIAYAQQRLLEEMYPDEPFGRPEFGTVNDAAALDARALLAMHRKRLRTAPVEAFVVGDVGEHERDLVRAALERLPHREAPRAPAGERFRTPGPPRRVVEDMALAQSKLHVGYRADMRGLVPRQLYAARLFNAVLGGGSTSKLFKEVREKRSLAYYAHSHFDRLKGHMTLAAGVSAKNADRALEVMRAQVDAMRRGEFDDGELEVARAAILNALRGVNDSAFSAAEYVSLARAGGRPADPEQAMALVRALTRDDVVEAAARPVEELVYLLKGTDDDGTATA